MHLRVDGELARRLAAATDITYPEYVVLVALTDHDEGRLRSFELGDRLGWEKSRVSHQVRRMEQRGLVVREPCADDGRGAHVVVTAAGRRSIEAAWPSHVDAVRSLFIDHLTEGQLDQLTAIAEHVLTAIDGVGADQATGSQPSRIGWSGESGSATSRPVRADS
jgi:DNA-binding MarR family transcriptional regulator